MTIGVLKESSPETRVSILPEHIALFKKLNVDVLIEIGAGINAFASDQKFAEAGAKVVSKEEVLNISDIILSINIPSPGDIALIQSKILLGNYQPLYHADVMQALAEKKITAFSIDMIPRTTRAQTMDVLSSQANIAGYKAVLLAANMFP